MLNFIDFKKAIRKCYLTVYPDGLPNVGFEFSPDDSTGVDMVRLRVSFFNNGCDCIFLPIYNYSLMTYDKAWQIYTESLFQVC